MLLESDLIRAMHAAHEAGIRLEVHQGLPIWEPMPMPWITLAIHRIRSSITQEFTYLDMPIRFEDGSVRRPDIAIFSTSPQPTLEPTRLVPEAVIEVVSPGSEIKDWDLSPPFYLMHGVKDAIVFDPRTGGLVHFRKEGRARHESPVEIALEYGCTVTV